MASNPKKQFSENLDLKPRSKKIWLYLFSAALIFFILAVSFLSPFKGLSLLLALILIFGSFYQPQYLLLALVLYLPFEPFILKFIPDEIYLYARYLIEGLIYLLLISVGSRIIFKRDKFVRTPLDWSFLLFLFISLVSIIVNFVPVTIGFLGTRQIIRFILVFYLAINLKFDQAFIKKIILALLLVVLLESAIGYLQVIIGSPANDFLSLSSKRLSFSGQSLDVTAETEGAVGQYLFATLGRYDQLGTFLTFFLLLTIGLIYEVKDLRESKNLIYLLIFSLPILALTYSRASWFGFVLGFLLISLVIKRSKIVFYSLIGLLVIVIGYALISDVIMSQLVEQPNPSIVQRFFEAFSYERWRGEYLGYGRLYFIIKTPLVVVRYSPLFGVGPGQYGGGAAVALHNVSKYDELGLPFGVYGTEGYIDNNWMSLWGETGTLGLLAYLAIFWILARSGYRVYKYSQDRFNRGLALGFLGGLLAIAFQAFLGTYLEVRTLAFYFWLIGGFVVWLGIKEKISLGSSRSKLDTV